MTEETFEPEIDPGIKDFCQFLYDNGFFVACAAYEETEGSENEIEPQVTILDITGNTIEESLKLRLLLEGAGVKVVPDPDEEMLNLNEATILVAYDAGDDVPPQILVFGVDDEVFNRTKKKAKLRLLN